MLAVRRSPARWHCLSPAARRFPASSGAPRPGYQGDGSYVMSSEQQALGCRELQARQVGLQERMQPLPEKAVKEMQELPTDGGRRLGTACRLSRPGRAFARRVQRGEGGACGAEREPVTQRLHLGRDGIHQALSGRARRCARERRACLRPAASRRRSACRDRRPAIRRCRSHTSPRPINLNGLRKDRWRHRIEARRRPRPRRSAAMICGNVTGADRRRGTSAAPPRRRRARTARQR